MCLTLFVSARNGSAAAAATDDDDDNDNNTSMILLPIIAAIAVAVIILGLVFVFKNDNVRQRLMLRGRQSRRYSGQSVHSSGAVSMTSGGSSYSTHY